MEAPEGRGRITPLPPPQPDGMSRPDDRAPRPWLPAVLGLVGFVVFALWLAGSSVLPQTEPAAGGDVQSTVAPLSAKEPATLPPTTTTSTTRAPTLGESIPDLGGSLLVFSTQRDDSYLNVWDPNLSVPQRFRLSGSRVVAIEPEPSSLNLVAYETVGRVKSLFVGGWQDQEPVFVGSLGFAWDPGGTSTLMWIGKDQTTGATGLYRQPFAGVTELVSPVDEGVRLIGWTDHGLVTANDLGPPVTVTNPNGSISTQSPTITELRDLAGTVVARAVAEPLRTAPVGRIIALGTSRAFDVAEIEPPESALALPAQHVALEATAGTLELVNIPVPEALSDGELMFSVIEPWSLSNDGEWAARVTAAGVSTALVVERISSQTRRVLALRTEGERATVGFSQDGAWFFTYSPRAGELTATTMGASATFSIDFDQRIRFGGVYIRQTPGG